MNTEHQMKIIKIIDEHRIVVNAGTNHRVHIGDEFEVYEVGQLVTDPETGEELGTLDPIKAYLEVRHVYPKICVCVNSEKISLTSPLQAALSPLTETFGYKPKKFNVNIKDISGGWLDSTTISVGDLVRPKRS